jgi:hypothetical protein
MNMPQPLLFTDAELANLDPQMRTVEPVAALAAIADLGERLSADYDTMTPQDQRTALAMSEHWPQPEDDDGSDLPEALREYLPDDYDDDPAPKELIRRRGAVARDRLLYLQEWRRFLDPVVLKTELNRLIETGAIDDRKEAIKRLEAGETLASYVLECEAMRELDGFLLRERGRVDAM